MRAQARISHKHAAIAPTIGKTTPTGRKAAHAVMLWPLGQEYRSNGFVNAGRSAHRSQGRSRPTNAFANGYTMWAMTTALTAASIAPSAREGWTTNSAIVT